MKIFGLISLLISIAIVVWLVSDNLSTGVSMQNDDGSVAQISHQEAIDSAQNLVDGLSGRASTANKKVSVYDGITVATDIQFLDLPNKGLTGSLKAEIRQLSNLVGIDISGNDFTGLPAEIGQLSKLEVLNFSNNPITGLPLELGNLKNLRTLDLRGTQYSAYDLDLIKLELSADVQILTD